MQVTVKPPVVSHTEKEPLLSSGSVPVVKAEASKPSNLKGENSVIPHKEIEVSSSSSFSQPKPGLEVSYASAASPGSSSVSTISANGDKTGVVVPSPVEDKHEKQGNRDLQDQVSHGLFLSA